MNYGETLAYWYLRLNGFFPLRNFVLHPVHESAGDDRRHNESCVKACRKQESLQARQAQLVHII